MNAMSLAIPLYGTLSLRAKFFFQKEFYARCKYGNIFQNLIPFEHS